MVIAQRLASSLAAGLFTAGLGLTTIATPGAAEATGMRSTDSTTATAPVETAGLFGTACSLVFFLWPGDTTRANYKFCLSLAPATDRTMPQVAAVFRA